MSDDALTAIAALEEGEVVILPTDTVYGLAALPDHSADLAELKGRPAQMPIAMLVAEPAQAWELLIVNRTVERLAARFWPGPLTIVSGAHGVRCPDHDLVRRIASAVGPVAATSANAHGEPTPSTAAGAAALFPSVAVVIDGGELPGAASTVVRVEGDELDVLREGPITSAALLAAVHSRP